CQRSFCSTTLSPYTTLFRSDKSFGEDEVRDVIRRVRDAGISVIANYIFGLPEADQATMPATLDLVVLGQAEDVVGDHANARVARSEEHTSELQSRRDRVCRP